LERREKPGDHLMLETPPRRAVRTLISGLKLDPAAKELEPGNAMIMTLPPSWAMRSSPPKYWVGALGSCTRGFPEDVSVKN
jgi:hypothetical protein